MLINYRGHDSIFPQYPVSDILDGISPAGTFKDKIVLIGPTTLGIYDLRVTPFTANITGIEKHASVVVNILQCDFFTRADTGVLPSSSDTQPDGVSLLYRGTPYPGHTKMFSSYVSKRIVDELIRDASKAKLGGDRKEIAVPFSDPPGVYLLFQKASA
jgi:hypothetical protein